MERSRVEVKVHNFRWRITPIRLHITCGNLISGDGRAITYGKERGDVGVRMGRFATQ